jgi:hypothetical protein
VADDSHALPTEVQALVLHRLLVTNRGLNPSIVPIVDPPRSIVLKRFFLRKVTDRLFNLARVIAIDRSIATDRKHHGKLVKLGKEYKGIGPRLGFPTGRIAYIANHMHSEELRA